jgi:hypothetical protein
MTRTTALARGAVIAEAAMVDACTIRRRTGASTDPVTGVSTPSYTTLYTGKCRIQQRAVQRAEQADVGQDYELLLRLQVQLPLTVTGLKVGDEVVMTAAGRDPDLVSRVFRIRDLAHKTDATSRRVHVLEKTD